MFSVSLRNLTVFRASCNLGNYDTEKAMRDLISQYLRGEEGATAIEYSLIATGISIAIVVVVYTLGDDVAALYEGLVGIFTS